MTTVESDIDIHNLDPQPAVAIPAQPDVEADLADLAARDDAAARLPTRECPAYCDGPVGHRYYPGGAEDDPYRVHTHDLLNETVGGEKVKISVSHVEEHTADGPLLDRFTVDIEASISTTDSAQLRRYAVVLETAALALEAHAAGQR